jgi:hypothetical protein
VRIEEWDGKALFRRLSSLVARGASTEPEDIEAVMEALSDEGINLIDEDQS